MAITNSFLSTTVNVACICSYLFILKITPKVIVIEKNERVRTSAQNKKLGICLKLDVLRKLQNGMKVMEVVTSLNLSDGTVTSIRKNRLKIEE